MNEFALMIYQYRAYGLVCVCNVPIPGFYSQPITSQSASSDIVLDLISAAPEWVAAARCSPTHVIHPESASIQEIRAFGADEAFEIAYADGTQFLVDGFTRRVWGYCPSGFGMDYLATYLRGPVMGFILRRRGVTALHASAVSLYGRAIVMCGESRSGKSTIAAALALRGVPVLCEDVAALKMSSHGYCIEPGYAQVGLWPDAVESLLGSADALPRLTSSWEKCFLPLDGERARFEPDQQSLQIIYLLAPRTSSADVPRVEELSPSEALIGLVKNTYMNWLLDRKQRAAEFDFLSTLVSRIPVRRIVPHSDPARIATLCDVIVADAQALRSREARLRF